MEKKEPKIMAEGFTNEELYQWMREKASAGSQLQWALAQKAHLQQALAQIEVEILELTNAAALEFADKNLDPIHHH
ncbi:hypothetical protein [Atlantibacter sp.]|uniref:hypothetical protein n=1 Tax=Atlantibacter sp. TaxID=1903473 RepID=UPI00289F3055|nr:hypothetical protein [Atlantibacter sp.]